jgi:2-polyprenyl-3-methyl-5-hydroxy-6-metoxy-1,4-benzoquinol methylase
LGHKINLIGMIAGKIFGRPDFADWFERISVPLSSEILDVGCGIGQRVSYLRDVGFHRVIGIDPYIENDIDYGKNCRVFRCELADIEDRFDLIMFNHSLEHFENPVWTLEIAKQRLKEDGVILIRTPVASSAWLKYGVQWVQLDAPRHLHVHTVRSMNIMTSQVGLKVIHVGFEELVWKNWTVA